ncbi:TPA: type IV pilus biogenesis protein PilP, partial [Salmonella enterica subsp. enterica]
MLMPKNSVFISGVLLMAFSAGAFSQPTLAVPPSAEVISAMPASEPATEAAASISSADLSDTVPIFPGNSVTAGQLEALQGKNLLLEAKVQAARLLKELTSAQTPGDVGNVPTTSPFVMGMPAEMNA